MQVESILAGVTACFYTAWATSLTGLSERLELEAASDEEALAAAFACRPRAAAMSVRRADRHNTPSPLTAKETT